MKEQFKEKAVEFLLAENYPSPTYAIITTRGIVPRVNRPCYGEMRGYGPESTRPNDAQPSDLRNDFPQSKPAGVALYIKPDKKCNSFLEYLWGEHSPWLNNNIHEKISLVKNSDGIIIGVVLDTAEFYPTQIVALMMYTRNGAREQKKWTYNKFFEVCGDPKLANLATVFFTCNIKSTLVLEPIRRYEHSWDDSPPTYGLDTYCLAASSNLKRMYNQDPVDLDEGGLWSNHTAYNRPDLANIFTDGQNSVDWFALSREIKNHKEPYSYILDVIKDKIQ